MKKIINKINESLPDIIKNGVDWIKDNFSENCVKVLDNSTGTVGIIIKIFGQNIVDKYLEKLTTDKLKNFGELTYLKAAYLQATKSIESIQDILLKEIEPHEMSVLFSDVLTEETKIFDKSKILLIFQPEYHPCVCFVKNNYINILKNIGLKHNDINIFLSDFNLNISNEIKRIFGDDYEKHLAQISNYSLNENEAKLLWETAQLEKIGFDVNKNLTYEETFGCWKDINDLKKFGNENISDDEIDEIDENNDSNESKLKNINELIDSYFNKSENNHLDKILFIIADFGKGKSVFLKHFASVLAKKYIETKEGEFPIYFNLRNFHNYSQNTQFGVIEDYLLTDYAIDIKSPNFIKKKYFFLIDSLDESGELNKISIEKVVNSIKQIQNLDKEKYRSNKIIITSRPFDNGLDFQLKQHKPKTRLNTSKREIIQYLSIYGFKKNQFNNWLINSIKKSKLINNDFKSSITNKIIESIQNKEIYDIYRELINNDTLSKSELRRPIFAYMIYQLIINDVDFLDIGKIGIYLSFLNLLTKDAKHINDPNFTVNLNEEFEYRNLLHTISSLWMFERHQGKQGLLSKADICRVLDGENRKESDNEILLRYKNKGVTEIEFLSHSYFGENDNSLHFQHQSFAEILLAEYYLKVFIKHALDKDFNIEEARTKLILGLPTDQTIFFLIDLLKLLKDSISDNITPDIIEKRKLLFPLLASLATEKNNNLFCNDLYYEWFKNCEINENDSSYPQELINDWYFNHDKIHKILLLCKEIINSNNTYLLTKSEYKNALYDNELTLLYNTNINELTIDFERWLALLVGNTLCNSINEKEVILFNTEYEVKPSHLFDLIIQSINKKNNQINLPTWCRNLFIGIDMRKCNEKINLYCILNYLDFSYSYLKNINFSGSLLGKTNFSNTSLENVNFSHCYMWETNFKNLVKIERCISNSIIISETFISFKLFFEENHIGILKNVPIIIPQINPKDESEFENKRIKSVLEITSQIFSYLYANNKITVRKINELVRFESAKMKSEYLNKIKSYSEEYKR